MTLHSNIAIFRKRDYVEFPDYGLEVISHLKVLKIKTGLLLLKTILTQGFLTLDIKEDLTATKC
jgi:hypothetical protein